MLQGRASVHQMYYSLIFTNESLFYTNQSFVLKNDSI